MKRPFSLLIDIATKGEIFDRRLNDMSGDVSCEQSRKPDIRCYQQGSRGMGPEGANRWLILSLRHLTNRSLSPQSPYTLKNAFLAFEFPRWDWGDQFQIQPCLCVFCLKWISDANSRVPTYILRRPLRLPFGVFFCVRTKSNLKTRRYRRPV